MIFLQSLSKFVPLLLWFSICSIGGIWLVRSLFSIPSNEEWLVGIAIGLSISTFFVNILGRVLPFLAACWVSAAIVSGAGLLLIFLESKKNLRKIITFPIQPKLWVAFFGVTILFWSLVNGLSIMDEFQTLPLISQMAAGDLPLHSPLDPNIIYNYHYFPYLFSAQLMSLGDIFPWTALDIQQALFASMSTFLLGLWVYRITKNQIAGISAGLFYFFSGGTRWFLLFLPQGILKLIDGNISRIGSGLNSGTSLQNALTSSWAAQGTGPFSIPFAFANGFNAPNSIGLGYTNLPLFFLALLLLTFNRWKNWKAIPIYIILLCSLALSHEIAFVFLILGTIAVYLILAIQKKKIRMPRELNFFLIALVISGIIAIFQGGVISGIFSQWLNRFGTASSANASFHGISISLAIPPAFVDAHLGILSVLNPVQFLLWLVETGPMILLLVLAIPWGIIKFKEKNWVESILAIIIPLSLLLVLINIDFKSSSLGALTRAQDYFLLILKIIAIPVLFIWFPKRSESIRIVIIALIVMTIFGGLVIFGLQMSAIQKPVLSTFIEPLDAKIMKEYWNKLDPTYMVFDPGRMRSAVIFGHASRIGPDWFTNYPEWIEIYNNPSPARMVKEGFGYLYADQGYIHSLPQIVLDGLNAVCATKLTDIADDFGGKRVLWDLRSCG
jgi:hypothetical protein